MVAIDWQTNTATITLLTMHPQPQIGSEGWVLSEINWNVVGAIKIPMPVIDALLIYYLQQISNGLDILPIIQKYMKEHPKNDLSNMAYGPTIIKGSHRNEQ
jgi:hypothetical protein